MTHYPELRDIYEIVTDQKIISATMSNDKNIS